jgi:hypothetical protein
MSGSFLFAVAMAPVRVSVMAAGAEDVGALEGAGLHPIKGLVDAAERGFTGREGVPQVGTLESSGMWSAVLFD